MGLWVAQPFECATLLYIVNAIHQSW